MFDELVLAQRSMEELEMARDYFQMLLLDAMERDLDPCDYDAETTYFKLRLRKIERAIAIKRLAAH